MSVPEVVRREIALEPVPIVVMILLTIELLFEPGLDVDVDSKEIPLELLPRVVMVLSSRVLELAGPMAVVLSRMP